MSLPDVPTRKGMYRFWRPGAGRIEPAPTHVSAPISPDQLAAQEAEMKRHKGIVAEGVLAYLKRWDKVAADAIGFQGNILETISANSEHLRVGGTIEGISRFINPKDSSFSVDPTVTKDTPLISYTIGFPRQGNLHSNLVIKPEIGGELRVDVNARDYSRLQVNRIKQRSVSGFRTFPTQDSREGVICILPSERTEVYYHGIDREGNTGLNLSSGHTSILNSDRDHRISFRDPYKNYVVTDNEFIFFDYNRTLRSVPLFINIYDTINALIPDITFPALQQ
jgi:hypothetical protein